MLRVTFFELGRVSGVYGISATFLSVKVRDIFVEREGVRIPKVVYT